MPPFLKVVLLVLVGVSLPLEADAAVGLARALESQEADEPFKDVPQVEGQVQQLAHLRRVDGLVADVGGRHRLAAAHEDEAEEVDALVALEWD